MDYTEIKNWIFVKEFNNNSEWKPLMNGFFVINCMNEAIEFVRLNISHKNIGLANFNNMLMDNAQWDNL